MPKISVIIPCFNGGKFLRRCLNSVIGQLPPEELEVIVIDDCSKDDSAAVAAEFPAVRLIRHQVNQGVSVSRNDGIAAANGEFITFLDADDWLFPNALAAFLKYQREADADLVWLNANCVDDAGAQKPVSKKSRRLKPAVCENLMSDRRLLQRCHFVFDTCWSKIFRTSLIRQHKLSFNPELKFGEDTLFSNSYLCYCQRVTLRPEVIGYAYYENTQSCVHTIDVGRRLEQLALLIQCLQSLVETAGAPEVILLHKCNELIYSMKKYSRPAERPALLQAWGERPEFQLSAEIIRRHGSLKQRFLMTKLQAGKAWWLRWW